MFAKVKPQVFLDKFTVEITKKPIDSLIAVLRDDRGQVHRSVNYGDATNNSLTVTGLSDLPYGVYSLELSHGDEQLNVRLVKRV